MNFKVFYFLKMCTVCKVRVAKVRPILLKNTLKIVEKLLKCFLKKMLTYKRCGCEVRPQITIATHLDNLCQLDMKKIESPFNQRSQLYYLILNVETEIQTSNRLYETTQSWNVTDTIATNAVSISKLWFDDFFSVLFASLCVFYVQIVKYPD